MSIEQGAFAGASTLAAIATLRAKLNLAPQDASLWGELGLAAYDAGDLTEARFALEKAVELGAGVAAQNNLASVMLAQGDANAAATQATALIQRAPGYALAYFTLARAHTAQRATPQALVAFAAAVNANPALEGAWLGAASVLIEERQFAKAAEWLQRATQALPQSADLWVRAGVTMADWGHYLQALAMYQRALAIDPLHLRARLGWALTMPLVPASRAEIAEARARAAKALAEIEAQLVAILERASNLVPLEWNNFFLAYQGDDDRPLQEAFARIAARQLARALPQFAAAASADGDARPKRVGFVSRFFYSSTVGYYFKEWIVALAAAGYDVHVFAMYFADDSVSQEIARAATAFHKPYPTLSAAADAIRTADLDLLIYPELGMDSRTFALAALRLAPVQCMAWGHPVTSGHATIDYAFTSGAMEPPNSAPHWREKLIPLPGLGTCYQHPGLPDSFGARADFGLPERVPLILYPQSLFKIHPDNDALVVAILNAVPSATLVMFQGQTEVMTQRFVARMSAAFHAANLSPQGRIKLLPNVDHLDYLRINHHCDIMLDTLHWSGGNTSLDAIASGLPIVTLPGTFMRGRQSAAMLQWLGCGDEVATSASDYVARAVQLLTDIALREAYRDKLRAGQKRLFNDRAPVSAFVAAVARLVEGQGPA